GQSSFVWCSVTLTAILRTLVNNVPILKKQHWHFGLKWIKALLHRCVRVINRYAIRWWDCCKRRYAGLRTGVTIQYVRLSVGHVEEAVCVFFSSTNTPFNEGLRQWINQES